VFGKPFHYQPETKIVKSRIVPFDYECAHTLQPRIRSRRIIVNSREITDCKSFLSESGFGIVNAEQLVKMQSKTDTSETLITKTNQGNYLPVK